MISTNLLNHDIDLPTNEFRDSELIIRLTRLKDPTERDEAHISKKYYRNLQKKC